MNLTIRTRLPLLLLAFICHNVWAQNIARIGQMLDSANAASPFFGNVLITGSDGVLLEKSYGYADAVRKKPLTRDHSFQVASISKQFTAYGIMLLKNRGLVEYDSFVTRYIPGFPYAGITVRHLLHHTSALPDFWDDIRPNLDTTKPVGNKDVLEYLVKHRLPLQAEPGITFRYADIGYDFLANIIENVSGLSYQDFMYRNVFKPLKMKSTIAYPVTDIRQIENKNLAVGHIYESGKFTYAHLAPKYHFVYYLGNFYGDGSVVTTARDLALWSRAWKKCKLLPCNMHDEATIMSQYKGEPVYVRRNPDIGYGFGWYLRNDSAGRQVYHSGAHPGNIHFICRLPEKDITFIFLSNAETQGVRELRSRILSLLQE